MSYLAGWEYKAELYIVACNPSPDWVKGMCAALFTVGLELKDSHVIGSQERFIFTPSPPRKITAQDSGATGDP